MEELIKKEFKCPSKTFNYKGHTVIVQTYSVCNGFQAFVDGKKVYGVKEIEELSIENTYKNYIADMAAAIESAL